MTNRKEYTTEFKLEAIKLVKGTGQPSAKIARDFSISGKQMDKVIYKKLIFIFKFRFCYKFALIFFRYF